MMHGPTFMAQPARLRGGQRQPGPAGDATTAERAGRPDRGRARRGARARARTCASVVDVRVLGAVGVVELDRPVDVAAVTEAALDRGRVGAAVPQPRLHDAAVRHHDRPTSAHDHRRDGRGGRRGARLMSALRGLAAPTGRRSARTAGLTRRLATRAPVGAGLLDLAGNDYLGLARHPRVVAGRAAAAAGVRRRAPAPPGWSPARSRSTRSSSTRSPTSPASRAALVFSTGYHANLSAVSALADADTLVVSDAHVHASMIDACRLSRAGVQVVPHNDVAAVGRGARRPHPATRRRAGRVDLLASSATPPRWPSWPRSAPARGGADGRRGPRARRRRARRPRPAARGRAGRTRPTSSRPLTLRKSLGAQGGVVLASRRCASTWSTGRARSSTTPAWRRPRRAAALAALGWSRTEPDRGAGRRARPHARRCLRRRQPAGAVLAVPMPGRARRSPRSRRRAEHGVRIGCFRPPSTPDGISRLRLTAHADLDDDELGRAVAGARASW